MNSCEYFEDNVTSIAAIEKNIKRYNPHVSKSIFLIPNYGSPDKTLKVYKYRNNNEIERVLLFHFADRFNYELPLDTLTIVGDNKEIKKKIYDDASVVLSNVQDLIFYVILFEKEYKEVFAGSTLSFRIHDMLLHVEPKCKHIIMF